MRFKLSSYLFVSIVTSFAMVFSSFAPAAAYAPENGFSFNDPTGTTAQQYSILNKMNQALNNAPKGSTVRIAMYSGGVESFNQAVKNAHNRGVNVRIVSSAHSSGWTHWPKLTAALGTNTASRSFAVTCEVGCFSTKSGSYQHAKFLTFSQTGTAKQVVMVTSANQTSAQAETGWNNMYSFSGDSTQYRAYYTYFDRMVASAAKKDTIDYYRTSTSSGLSSVFMPSISSRTHPYSAILNKVNCSAASGYGYNGKTTVRVAMSIWSEALKGIAEKLVQLDNAGCTVEAIISAHGVHSTVQSILTKSTKYGGIEVRNASQDANKDGKLDRYLHDKAIAISGGFGSSQTKTVWIGSMNLSTNGFRANNEILVKINNASAWQDFTEHYVKVERYSPVMRSSASSSRLMTGSSVETSPVPGLNEKDVFPEDTSQ